MLIFNFQHLPGIKEFLSSYLETLFGAIFIYVFICSTQYLIWYIWLKEKYLSKLDLYKTHPMGELQVALTALIWESFPVTILRFLRQDSYMYTNIQDYGWLYFVFSIFLTLAFTEFLVYWVHRLEHEIPWLYKNVHYLHHEFIYVTPFCGWAFHPLDSIAQALPMMTAPFFFPVHQHLHTFMTLFLSMWGISIHDNMSFITLQNVIPSDYFLHAAHHTIHHDSGRKKNYGQFTVFWDKVFGTYEKPKDPFPFMEKKNIYSNFESSSK